MFVCVNIALTSRNTSLSSSSSLVVKWPKYLNSKTNLRSILSNLTDGKVHVTTFRLSLGGNIIHTVLSILHRYDDMILLYGRDARQYTCHEYVRSTPMANNYVQKGVHEATGRPTLNVRASFFSASFIRFIVFFIQTIVTRRPILAVNRPIYI